MKYFVVPTLLFCIVSKAFSVDLSDPWILNKSAILDKESPMLLQKYKVPSVSLALSIDGQIKLLKTIGFQSEKQEANFETLYDTASLGKPITTEIVLRLASDGLISIDEPMAKHWIDPDLKGSPYIDRLTVRKSLIHQTGLPNWRYMTEGKLKFIKEPGTERTYSGEGMDYVLKFIESKLSKDFSQLADEYLFQPAGMNNTFYKAEESIKDRMAHGFIKDQYIIPKTKMNISGAGGVRTTAEDYVKFMNSIMQRQLLNKKTHDERFVIALDEYKINCLKDPEPNTSCPPKLGFGLGWYVYDYPTERIIGHTGANRDLRTLGLFIPEKKLSLAIFTNGENGNHVINEILKILEINEKFILLVSPKTGPNL
ncbi:serine hydrolase domain-containing protein [Marinicella sp. W31]|uniref:serine hydrolase domain-containing protein n=1 Tax=Marinicella sp. W31 TaxID=3023713 RepID=UPI00375678AB